MFWPVFLTAFDYSYAGVDLPWSSGSCNCRGPFQGPGRGPSNALKSYSSNMKETWEMFSKNWQSQKCTWHYQQLVVKLTETFWKHTYKKLWSTMLQEWILLISLQTVTTLLSPEKACQAVNKNRVLFFCFFCEILYIFCTFFVNSFLILNKY